MRFKYHLQAPIGWINDPNGLSFYKGKIHAFYQYNPYSTKWDTMHWGHATSKNFLKWKDKGIALKPTESYENTYGCFSGSAIVVGDKHYLFYTGVSSKYGQSQCLAIGDGKEYKKYDKNPIIVTPLEDKNEFRDPKVFYFKDKYFMVCGGKDKDNGVILLYSSTNLTDWEYLGIIYSTNEFGGTLECPDLFPVKDKWVLMFSAMQPSVERQVFVLGDFNGKEFIAEKVCYPILGTDFYAGQTFDYKGERVLIGWCYHHLREVEKGETTAGAFSIPCNVDLVDNELKIYPVKKCQKLLKSTCDLVEFNGKNLVIKQNEIEFANHDLSNVKVDKIEYILDKKLLEIFINDGQYYITQWLVK